jgi:hypothetical protein
MVKALSSASLLEIVSMAAMLPFAFGAKLTTSGAVAPGASESGSAWLTTNVAQSAPEMAAPRLVRGSSPVFLTAKVVGRT